MLFSAQCFIKADKLNDNSVLRCITVYLGLLEIQDRRINVQTTMFGLRQRPRRSPVCHHEKNLFFSLSRGLLKTNSFSPSDWFIITKATVCTDEAWMFHPEACSPRGAPVNSEQWDHLIMCDNLRSPRRQKKAWRNANVSFLMQFKTKQTRLRPMFIYIFITDRSANCFNNNRTMAVVYEMSWSRGECSAQRPEVDQHSLTVTIRRDKEKL